LKRSYQKQGAVAVAVALSLELMGTPAGAAQMLVPRIDSFGPYKLGMTLDQAKAAHKGGKPASCGDIAADRQCIVLDAAVFDEPGVIYAVLDASGAKVERIVAQLDPQLTQRRAYRCVRLAEKVFSLLAVVYGSKFKQSYDQNRRPLPAVAWDGELYGRLIFETKCRSAEEGNPRISIVGYQPEGVDPAKVAEAAKPKEPVPTLPLPPALAVPSAAGAPAPLPIDAPPANSQAVAGLPASISLAAPDGSTRAPIAPEAPVPARAPIGVVEEIRPDTSGAVMPGGAMAALTRELAQAKGKALETPAPPATASHVQPAAVPQASVPEPAAFPAPLAPASVPIPAPATPASVPASIGVARAVPAPAPAPAVEGTAAAAAVLPDASATPVAAPKPAQSVDNAVAARLAPPASMQPIQAQQTAALPPVQPRRPGDADEFPDLPDLVAPEPFMVPEEEELFRRLREAPQQAASVQPARPSAAASAPFALLSVTPPTAPKPQAQAAPQLPPQSPPQPVASQPAADAPAPARQPEPIAPATTPAAQPVVQEAAAGPMEASAPIPKIGVRSVAPVLTGGWRHRAPVPPARPWRERVDAAGAGAS
jgi:hypothetical protein